jgi:hypothetical protein
MRNTQRIIEFIKKWENKLPNHEIIYDYKNFCKNLLYEDEEIVFKITNILKNNISLWAKQNSPVYFNHQGIIQKEDLLNKEQWYTELFAPQSKPMATNGSTTGFAFSYLRWDPFLYFIEGENHYDLILDEFNIQDNFNLLYFIPNDLQSNKFIEIRENSGNFMEHHGTKRKATTHIVNIQKSKKNEEEFFIYLFEYLKQNKIDVILTTGPNIYDFCNYIRKFKIKHKICNLLSNTNEFLLSSDVAFLTENKFVDNVCDHMRCWDGGASFFTCKEKNYHLMDNLSWCEEVDTKLISTDYFSFPSPFVNYWNGDYCKIDNKYQRCDCGRLYRDFEFLENRPFSLKGMCLKDIKDKIKEMDIQGITQARCSVDSIDIISNKELSEQEKLMIRNITNKFKFNFIKEG